jgi:hypothetical protein
MVVALASACSANQAGRCRLLEFAAISDSKKSACSSSRERLQALEPPLRGLDRPIQVLRPANRNYALKDRKWLPVAIAQILEEFHAIAGHDDPHFGYWIAQGPTAGSLRRNRRFDH